MWSMWDMDGRSDQQSRVGEPEAHPHIIQQGIPVVEESYQVIMFRTYIILI